MKTKFIILFILFSSYCFCQTTKDLKNLFGIYAGIEWNTISGLKGVDFERNIYSKGNIGLGVKASYIFSYKKGNMQLLHSSNDGSSTVAQILGTARLFTSQQKETKKGFFLYGGVGIGARTNRYADNTVSLLLPVSELGFGWQFIMGDKADLLWTNGISFAGEGGITLTRISIGF